jgi:hypothetical protein
MAILKEKLESIATEYTESMPPIRGRRVKKFILREFYGCIDVGISKDNNEIASFSGKMDNGDVLEIRTDGRGSSFEMYITKKNIIEIRSYSLLKDSLPLLNERSDNS